MGKGDKKSKRSKNRRDSYDVSRPKSKSTGKKAQ